MLWIFDSHFPKHISHDPLCRFIEKYKPDIIGLGGDTIGLDEISHHEFGKMPNKGYINIMNRFWENMDGYRDFVERIRHASGGCDAVYCEGNHELWIARFAEKFPQFRVPSIMEELGTVGKHMEWIPNNRFFTLGHVNITHGNMFRKKVALGKGAAQDALKTVFFGHYHTFDGAGIRSCVDDETTFVGVSVPGMTERDPCYNKGRPNAVMTGFLTVAVKMPSGKFSHHVQLVSPRDGSFLDQYGVEWE